MAKDDACPHESIQALLAEGQPGESATDIIIRKARAIVTKHRHLWKGPPFCPFELADLEGVIVQEAPCDIKSDGRIFPKGRNVYIEYAKDQCEERRRFTICHELAHTLFPDCYKRERRRSPAEKADKEFEDLCNVAAAEFLFPFEEFREDMGLSRVRAEHLRGLADRYKASIDATSRRIVALSNHPACVVFAVHKMPKGKAKTSLAVQYSVPNSRFAHNIYPNLRINSKSAANRAHTEQRPVSGVRENWYIAGQWGKFNIEATPLPKFESKATAHVAILLYPA
jgi:Zn-dependent peptidase ImmA (M78 family)